ncbi:hypothetical protein MHU86_9590 (mitochondrion) [Fragilaria crotonensis]|nr:hypothetical protein MHU86_9590 [Fragilaria crotonensis]
MCFFRQKHRLLSVLAKMASFFPWPIREKFSLFLIFLLFYPLLVILCEKHRF